MKRKFRKDKEKEKEQQAEAPQEQPAEETEESPQEQPAETQEPEAEIISDLKPLLEASRQKAEEYLNLAQRVQADFDNFRRRNQSVRADAYEDGARDLVKTLLPVVDNLERALAAESTDDTLKAGVAMVCKQLMDVLTKRGVEVIDRPGEVFDPNLETAVLQGTEEDGEKGTVCQVLQKGYRMGGVILRSAMVKVVPE